MKSILVQMILLLIIIVVHVSSQASLTCQQKILRCQSTSKACLIACTKVQQCDPCRKKFRSCSNICKTTNKKSGSKHSKNRNLKKLKRKIKKLLQLL
ncbi:Hypothetical predicted protein [Paramuricea clavata]|uniref:Uncharacterized protein n=2 Tax=Paramuricea clavata TaxID=317549 RepID=A0A6S7GPT7_PARCT|nr:Hypothetical predicted protein [Paramuricea clavata]